ncbi:hypothetical protein ACJX0J_037058, partial [Zea mays]
MDIGSRIAYLEVGSTQSKIKEFQETLPNWAYERLKSLAQMYENGNLHNRVSVQVHQHIYTVTQNIQNLLE